MTKEKVCGQCFRSVREGAKFGTLVHGNRVDDLCVKCRFNEIDAKYSKPEDIREDMRRMGIPVARRGKHLR